VLVDVAAGKPVRRGPARPSGRLRSGSPLGGDERVTWRAAAMPARITRPRNITMHEQHVETSQRERAVDVEEVDREHVLVLTPQVPVRARATEPDPFSRASADRRTSFG